MERTQEFKGLKFEVEELERIEQRIEASAYVFMNDSTAMVVVMDNR